MLKFQAAQATIYQVFVTLFYGLSIVISIFGSFAMMPMAFMDVGAQANTDLQMGVLVFALLTMCCASCISLAVPLFQIFGQWAGLRLLRGHDFRFPLIASLAEKFTSSKNQSGIVG